MTDQQLFEGYIKDVQYEAHLVDDLIAYDFSDFDINRVKSYGIINFENGQIAYSKWTSPKRTRTYPTARLYNTYNFPKILTVIPVLKDEGLDGDLDQIQYMMISWMNLLNVYVVLAYYENADKNRSAKQIHRNKLTHQRLNAELVKAQIKEISTYKQSALHWNRSLFENHFTDIYEKAIDAYEKVSSKTGVLIHPYKAKRKNLEIIKQEYQKFRDISSRSSQAAALRELRTRHGKEYLKSDEKYTFFIKNYLGGVYHLTIDEVLHERGMYIIQESKNSTQKSMPALSDIKDGLFRLILYSNLDSLKVNGNEVKFSARLKLTGYEVNGFLRFPCSDKEFDKFIGINLNRYTKGQLETLKRLRLEATQNRNLTIEIGSNNG